MQVSKIYKYESLFLGNKKKKKTKKGSKGEIIIITDDIVIRTLKQ